MSAVHTLIEAILADGKCSRYHQMAEEARAEARPVVRSTYLVTEPGKKPYESKDIDTMAAMLSLSPSSFRVYMSTNGGVLNRNGIKIERKKG